MAPGETPFTLTSGASSFASARVTIASPAIAADEIIPVGLGNLAERSRVERRCVIDEYVESTAPVDDGGDQFGERSSIQQVGLERGRGVRSQSVEVRNEVGGVFSGGTVMDADIGARRVQLCCNLGADAARSAGDQRDAAFETRGARHVSNFFRLTL
jgi:hypothetical protein